MVHEQSCSAPVAYARASLSNSKHGSWLEVICNLAAHERPNLECKPFVKGLGAVLTSVNFWGIGYGWTPLKLAWMNFDSNAHAPFSHDRTKGPLPA